MVPGETVDKATMILSNNCSGAFASLHIDLDDRTQRVTANLFAAMAAGPMGKAHPAKGNLASLDAPASTATGTGGSLAR